MTAVLPVVTAGIIPARAGFTRGGSHGFRGLADHPRSRGVYVYPSRYVKGTVGSSPLARGLQAKAAGDSAKTGIIPARAGFTLETEGKNFLTHGSSPLARGLRS